MITISFEDQALHDVCVRLERAEQLFGTVTAAVLVNFISEAMAFENVEELMDFLGDDVEISIDDSIFVSIGLDYRAALVVAGARFERDAKGRVVWASVARLKLVANIEAALKDGQKFTPDWFSKPGDSLRASMVRRRLTPQEIALHLQGGISNLRSLLDGTGAIGRSEAAVLAEHVGGTALFWLKRQANYDEALERAVDLATEIEGDDWLALPVPGGKPRGRLSPEKRRSEVRRRLTFFNVGTLKAWDARYGRICSDTFSEDRTHSRRMTRQY